MVSNAGQYSAWGKTHAIMERKPKVVYVGTSRVEIKLPSSCIQRLHQGQSSTPRSLVARWPTQLQ